MRLITVTVILILTLAGGRSVVADHSPMHPPEPQYEIVVELEPDQSPTSYAPYFLSQLGVPTDAHHERINHVYMYAIVGFSVFLTADELAKAERLFGSGGPGVRAIVLSQDMRIPVIALTSLIPESPIREDLQVVPSGISRIAALPRPGEDASNVDVAVIDTGVDARHPDLNVVGGYDCTVGHDQTQAWDRDVVGHGTHVAGTIAARDNGMGVVGVAPGARIWSIKVIDDQGYGTTASVICGLDYVVEHAEEIEVANMSLGGSGYPSACGERDPMHNAVCVAAERTVIVVAAGNETSDVITTSPANYPEVVTVSALADFDGQPGGAGLAAAGPCAAMSVDDELAAFSNYGDGVDIAAPGTCILSTLPGALDDAGVYQPAYGYASGTSMAAPHVAGAIARFLAANPDQRSYAIKQVLTWSAAHERLQEGDHDATAEPVLYVGNGAPRYECGPADPPGA